MAYTCGDKLFQTEFSEVENEIAKKIAFVGVIAITIYYFVAKSVRVKIQILFNLFLNVAVLGIKLIVLCSSCVLEVFD